MKSRFSRIFVYLLIVMCAIVILTWAIRPPAGEGATPQSDRVPQISSGPILNWLGWLTVSITAVGIMIHTILYTRLFNRQKRDSEEAFNNVAKHSLKEINDPAVVPLGPLAKMLDNLRQLGYSDLGKYEAPYPNNRPNAVWVLNSPERDVRAIGFMHDDAIAPTINLNTTFENYVGVETQFPSFTLALRRPDHMWTFPGSVATAINNHKRRASKLAAANGQPVKVNTLAEFFDLVKKGIQHSDSAGTRKYKMQVPVFAIGGLIALVIQIGILLITPTNVPVICVAGTFFTGGFLLRTSYLFLKELRKKPGKAS